MKFITVKYSTRLSTCEKYVYGYVDTETVHTQKLYRKYYFLGLKIWSKCYFEERVPVWAMIQLSCLGSTDWKSSNPELIEEHINKTNKQ